MLKLAILSSNHLEASKIHKELLSFISVVETHEAEIIIVIGGDGFMLHTIHHYLHYKCSFYGIRVGSIGFLMNSFYHDKKNELIDSIKQAKSSFIIPLRIEVTNKSNDLFIMHAINEIAIFRKTNQAAKMKIYINGIERVKELIADGVIIATAAGSTAYNFSAGGSIVPLDSRILCLTPICAFRPRKWHGALLPFSVLIECDILESDKRPVNVSADFQELSDILKVSISESKDFRIQLLFDHKSSLENKIIEEQFNF